MKPFSFVTRHKKASVITVGLLVVIGVPVALLARPKQPEFVTALAERGDIVQTVEAVGTVTSERDLELKFPLTGIIASVTVKEGDVVKAGQALAQLRSGNYAAAVGIQSASLQSALADLRKLEEGTRPEDIAIAEAQVANKRAALQVAQASLENAKKDLGQAQEQLRILGLEANTALAGQVETARTTIATQLVTGETALSVLEDVMGKTVVQDALVRSLGGEDREVRALRQAALTAIQSARQRSLAAQDHLASLAALSEALDALHKSGTALDQLFSLLIRAPETTYYTSAVREEYKNVIAAQRSAVQAALAAVSTAQSNLQSASATYDTRIGTARSTISASEGAQRRAEADILTYQTALQAQEADLALKRAGTRPTDIDAARARVRQAQASLAQAQSNYADTILRSPVDGTVTHVNVKVGESAPVTDPAVTVLGQSPFRIEMHVSEVDVPKLAKTQSGAIELDSFPGVSYRLRVNEIERSPRNVDGVSKYRVKLDFVHPHDEFRIGMTGDVTVTTGERRDVVFVPGRAVLTNDGAKVVRILRKGKAVEQAVTTGMEGQSGDVEITSGLEGGETVVILEK
ncbi:MAG: efflux RND transporter periplasmic adaptor subunit [Candidatus Peribacteraceae bacterium]|nr:efflux RND transporter periplasmic adaptor subunit [Candidatus Peribacteraceae bacterium]